MWRLAGTEGASATAALTAAVHLFEWDWPGVAHECEIFLGPKGFDGVQVSPPNEHLVGPQWWTRYQPVSYKLISRSGNEDEFKDMVRRCNAVGVMVIVDAVVNHMARGEREAGGDIWSGVGIAGSTFSNRTYPAVPYTQEDFHHSPGEPAKNCQIEDYDIVKQVHNCDLEFLPDLNTERAYTRSKILDFLRNVSACGENVGFRFDAAKHIPFPEFLEIVTAAGRPWQYAEVHSGPEAPPAVQTKTYLPAGYVTEFEYQMQVGQIFKDDGRMPELRNIGEGLISSDGAMVFIENHDTMRPRCLSCAPVNHDNGALFFLAEVFMLAWPFGYPLVMSTYAYPPGDHDQGPPPYPVVCGSGWHCEHRRPEVANMVAWRRTAGSTNVSDFEQDDTGNAIAFHRGGVAFVALNRGENNSWSAWMRTGLPQGSYCDVIQNDDVASCPHVEVNASGVAWITVPPLRAVALHVQKRFAGASGDDSDGRFIPWGILSFFVLGVVALLFGLLAYFWEKERKARKRRRRRQNGFEEMEEDEETVVKRSSKEAIRLLDAAASQPLEAARLPEVAPPLPVWTGARVPVASWRGPGLPNSLPVSGREVQLVVTPLLASSHPVVRSTSTFPPAPPQLVSAATTMAPAHPAQQWYVGGEPAVVPRVAGAWQAPQVVSPLQRSAA